MGGEAPSERSRFRPGMEWNAFAPTESADLHRAFAGLLRWNIQNKYRRWPKLDPVTFRMKMLPFGEQIATDGSVVMFGRSYEAWLQRMSDGTIACADPERWREIVRQNKALGEEWEREPISEWDPSDEREPIVDWPCWLEGERLYYAESYNRNEAAMQKAAGDALRAWGMPIPDFMDYVAQLRAIEASRGRT